MKGMEKSMASFLTEVMVRSAIARSALAGCNKREEVSTYPSNGFIYKQHKYVVIKNTVLHFVSLSFLYIYENYKL